jgi:phthiocerol/phenolphthiocerol synthesis type-I polyketide synthase C
MRGAANPIQIVGRSCRLPGAATVAQFWDNLVARRCSVGSIGADRWPIGRFHDVRPAQAGKSYTFAAGTIEGVWDFDPSAFGISPREALQLDPQQRLALQLSWEALEDALIPARRLAGRNVGVYAGASGLDYSTTRMFDAASADAYFMIGNTLSLISNRVSHAFDLRGPSLTIDTACSSSLVALHHAVEALASGKIEMAIVLGVNLLLSPFPFIGFAQASMLSPEGLCRAFDAKASGYVRAEGGVALVLRPARRAVVDSPRNYGQILATGTNSDGRTIGVALPSFAGQAKLIEEVHGRAGVAAEALAFVEAHGTGTRVGDPIEAEALGRALGQRRSQALPIGSVKSNIGHLEPASGLAGLLKAMLALEQDLLPASLHVEDPNPEIDFAALNLTIAREPVRLARTAGVRTAAISSFGFGGTNAHIVIADPLPAAGTASRNTPASARSQAARLDAKPTTASAGLLLLSAASEKAQRALAQAHLEQLPAAGALELDRLAGALAHLREPLPERAVLLARNRDELSAQLQHLAAGVHDRGVVRGRSLARDAKLAFVFSGNGSQWAGMGRAARAANPSFRAKLAEIDAYFAEAAGWSLLAALNSDDLAAQLASTAVAQPLLFSIQVATAAALADWGLEPDAVLGHSVGEVAAAQVAGALSLKAAVGVILARSTHQEPARGGGAMAALRLGQEAARESIARSSIGDIEIAAINSPRSVTLVGTKSAIAAYAAVAARAGVGCKVLDLDYPFHSRLLAPAAAPLAAALKGLRPKSCRIPFISTVTGAPLAGQKLDAGYWWRNVRDAVAFLPAVAAARGCGAQLFIEIGPRPILQGYLNECFAEPGNAAAAIGSLEVGDDAELDPMRRTLAQAIAHGGRVKAERAFAPPPRYPPPLPAYPWQNLPFRPQATVEALGELLPAGVPHPLLGWRGVAQDPCWHAHIDAENLAWLKDHCVNGQPVFPGAAFAEMALAAARQWLGEAAVEIRDMSLIEPLILRPGETSEVRTLLSPDSASLEIGSRPRLSAEAFRTHAVARYAKLPADPPAPASPPPAQSAPGERLGADAIYRAAQSLGLDYGGAFRRLAMAQQLGSCRLHVTLLPAAPEAAAAPIFGLHPTDLDAALHGLFAALAGRGDAHLQDAALVPVRFGRLRLFLAGQRVARADLVIQQLKPRSAQADVQLFDADDRLVAQLDDVRFAAMRLAPAPKLAELAYHEAYVALPAPATAGRRDLRALLDECARPIWRAEADAARADEPRLLLGAAACRIAYDALGALVGAEEIVPHHDGAGPDGGERGLLLRRLLLLLEAHDLAVETPAGWRRQACALPPAPDLLRTVLAEHPAWSADCVLLNRAAVLLKARLRAAGTGPESYAPTTLDHFRAASPRFAVRRSLAEILLALLAKLRATETPLRLCVVGLQDGLARQLVDAIDPNLCHLTLTDWDRRQLERTRLETAGRGAVEVREAAAGLGEAAAPLAYDLIVSAFALGRAPAGHECLADLAASLAPGGVLLASEADPDAFHELVFGLPLPTRPDEGAPWPCRLRSGPDWLAALAGAGFRAPSALALGAGVSVLVAAAGGSPAALAAPAAADRARAAPPTVGLVATTTPAEAKFAAQLADALAAVGRGLAPLARPHAGNGANGNGHGRGAAARNGRPLEAVVLVPARPTPARDVVWVVNATADAADDSAALAQHITVLAKLLASQAGRPLRLWIVAPGAVRAGADLGPAVPVQAGLWAAARTAANEYGDVDIRLVDLAHDLSTPAAAKAVAALIVEPPPDREVIVKRRGAVALRLRRGAGPPAPASPDQAARAVLAQAWPGSLEALAWQRQARCPPGPDEVEIEVAATGLNFRDVMWSLGLLPEEALESGFAGPTLGFECSGIVRAVGASVSDLAPGRAVVAFAPQAFASHVTVAARAVAPLPAGLEPAAAASIPVAFLTAFYALEHLARLRAGEWLLIHGGAGGVGLAALQIARWRGARVIATAGTEEKRDLLRLLGAEHALSSRSLAFVDQVRGITGAGVDVVLNSLAGEAMERSLELLQPFGRFLELGKRDFYANSKVGLRCLRHNVAYFAIDADQLLGRQPDLATRLLSELMQHFADGTFTPLAHRSFDGPEIVAAFRLMQQSGHIGKILVRPPPPADLPAPRPPKRMLASDEGAHVIIGGLGGFGLATAEWLAERGAKALVLVGRSGRSADAAQAALMALEARGIRVRALACDAADAAALGRLLADLRRHMPIKGIVHAAMVLDDGLLRTLDQARIARVLRAKLEIGRNLDRLTRDDHLDYFWLYSSVTSLIGNPGQAAYVAGNAALEALARVRRAAGLPALAVRFGAIEDVGILARDRDKGALLARRAGASGLRARTALNLLESLIAGADATQAGAVATLAAMNWGEARSQLALLRTPLFDDLRGLQEAAAPAGVNLLAAIKSLDDTGARELVARHLAGELASILRMPADDLNWHRPLAELGLDSLMAVELKFAATRRLGIELPVSAIADGASLSSIAEAVLARLRSAKAPGAAELTADQELADKHLDLAVNAERFDEISRQVGRRAQLSDRVLS